MHFQRLIFAKRKDILTFIACHMSDFTLQCVVWPFGLSSFERKDSPWTIFIRSPRIATKLDRFYTRRKNQFENLELLLCQQIELLTKYNNVFVYLLSKLDNPHYHTTNFSLFLTVSKPSLKIGSVNKAFLF